VSPLQRADVFAFFSVVTSCTPAPAPLPPLPETPQAELHECEPYADPEPRGRSEAIPPAAKAAYRARSGCACAPVPAGWGEDRGSCGPFPCTPRGCHVQECRVDEDCRAGTCSHYASWPHGYCVTDDAY